MTQRSTPFDLRSTRECDGITEEDVYSSCKEATVAAYRKENL